MLSTERGLRARALSPSPGAGTATEACRGTGHGAGKASVPVVDRPADHPHAVVREGGDGEAGDQREGVEGGDEDLAEALVPLVARAPPPELHHGVRGDGDGGVEDVGARQGAEQELQRLPLLLLGADAEDAPGVGEQRDPGARQPGYRIAGQPLLIAHGGGTRHHRRGATGPQPQASRAHIRPSRLVLGTAEPSTCKRAQAVSTPRVPRGATASPRTLARGPLPTEDEPEGLRHGHGSGWRGGSAVSQL